MIQIGDVYGPLTIISGPQKDIHQNKLWMCRCLCGNMVQVQQPKLTVDRLTGCRSCGNRRYITPAGRYLTTKEYLHLYNKVMNILRRCYVPTTIGWSNYGGRGIKVHAEWVADRPAFVAYLLTLPGWDDRNLTLDRINNDENYEPGNLRFVNQSVQNSNKRSTREGLRR